MKENRKTKVRPVFLGKGEKIHCRILKFGSPSLQSEVKAETSVHEIKANQLLMSSKSIFSLKSRQKFRSVESH